MTGEAGVFRGTFTVPAGGFEYKVAINESFDENYGAGGAPSGANIAVTAPGGAVTFTYNHDTHLITDDLPKSVTSDRAAHWVKRNLIAWDLPDQRAGFTYRLYWAAEGGLTNDDGTITGGSSFPLELVSSGLPASVRREFPHLASLRGASSAGKCAEPYSGDPDRTDRRGGVRREWRVGIGDGSPASRRLGRRLWRGAEAQPWPDLASGPAHVGSVGSHCEDGHAAAGSGRCDAGAESRDAAGH